MLYFCVGEYAARVTQTCTTSALSRVLRERSWHLKSSAPIQFIACLFSVFLLLERRNGVFGHFALEAKVRTVLFIGGPLCHYAYCRRLAGVRRSLFRKITDVVMATFRTTLVQASSGRVCWSYRPLVGEVTVERIVAGSRRRRARRMYMQIWAAESGSLLHNVCTRRRGPNVCSRRESKQPASSFRHCLIVRSISAISFSE